MMNDRILDHIQSYDIILLCCRFYMILFFLLLLLIEYCSSIITMAKLQEFHAVSLEHWGLMIINPNQAIQHMDSLSLQGLKDEFLR